MLFVTYLEDAAVYAQMYGSLLEVVLLLLWVYYSSALVLLGAVVTHECQCRRPSRWMIPPYFLARPSLPQPLRLRFRNRASTFSLQ